MPLEAPPTESFDMLNVQVCPACGQSDAIVQEVEDAQVAKCPHCQCEFPPRMESVTRKVIRRISEHRHFRLRRLAERLPISPPVRGLDPTDYALFRKIADGVARVQRFRPNAQAYEDALRQIRDRFIEQRVAGFVHPETGQQQPPVPLADAERRWVAVEPRFREVLMREPPEDVNRRLRLGNYTDEWQYEPEVTA